MPNSNVVLYTSLASSITGCSMLVAYLWFKYSYESKDRPSSPIVSHTSLESNVSGWHKFGQVQNVYMYPLLGCKGQSVRECAITEHGLIMKSNAPTLYDRKFVLYNKMGVLKPSRKYWLLLAQISVQDLDKNYVQFTAPKMSPLVILVNINDRMTRTMSTNILEVLECIDCGLEAANWVSSYLHMDVRLAYCPLTATNMSKQLRTFLNNIGDKVQIQEGQWNEIQLSYILDCIDNIVIGSTMSPLYMEFSKHWLLLTVQPNIVITADPNNILLQDEWDYLMIGDAVIHNSREKTINMPRNICDITNRYLVTGLNCEVIKSGIIKPGDNVYLGNDKNDDKNNDEN